MNVAIVGSGGYIASFLINRFERDSKTSRILKIDKTRNADIFLDLEHPDKFDYDSIKDIEFVVFTAAISGPDQCAMEYDLCWQVNVEGTIHFISEAIRRQCRVLFFSSDAVFGDIPGEIYTEKSETNATTSYGRMKKAVEDKFKDSLRFKAIRLSYVVSERDRFTSYCLDCIRKEVEADIFHPFYRNSISISDVEDVVLWFYTHFDEYEPFVFNVCGEELVSRVRMADELNRLFDNRLRYNISIPDEGFFKNRPRITQMKSIYNEKYGVVRDRSFTERLQEVMKGIRI